MTLPKLKKDKQEHSHKVRERVIFLLYRLLEKKRDIRSRQAFADRIHTTPAAISRWEALNGYPTVENLVDICVEFAVSPDWLMMGKGNMYGDAELITRIGDMEKRLKHVEDVVGINKGKEKPKT